MNGFSPTKIELSSFTGRRLSIAYAYCRFYSPSCRCLFALRVRNPASTLRSFLDRTVACLTTNCLFCAKSVVYCLPCCAYRSLPFDLICCVLILPIVLYHQIQKKNTN